MAQGGFSSGMDDEDGEETEDLVPLPFMDPFLQGMKKVGDEKFQAQLYEEAAAIYTFVLNYPTFMDTFFITEKLLRKRAVCFYKMGRYLDAIQDCEGAIARADNNENLLAKSVFIKLKAIVRLGDFVPAFNLAVWCKHLRPNCEKTKECLSDIKENMREAFIKDFSLIDDVLRRVTEFAETLNIDNNTRVLALESYTELLDLLDFVYLPGIQQRQAEILMNLVESSPANFPVENSEGIEPNNDVILNSEEEEQHSHVTEENPLAIAKDDAQEKMADSDQTKSEYAAAKKHEKAERRKRKNRKKKEIKKERKAQQLKERSSGQAPVRSVDERSPDESPDEGCSSVEVNTNSTEVRKSSSFDEFPNVTEGTGDRPTPNSIMHMEICGNAWVSDSPPDASIPSSTTFRSDVQPRKPTNEQLSSMSSERIPGQTSSSTGFACFTRPGQSDISSNLVAFSQSFQTKSATRMNSLNPPPGLDGPIKIPDGVFVVCDHFLQKKFCQFCEERGILKYAAWNNNCHHWQVMRPYPRLNVPPRAIFDVCNHFASDRPCPKDPCTFPHGEQERIMWTLERQGLLASPEESLQLTRTSIPVAPMITEPVLQESDSNNLPLQMPENRGASMTFLGDSIVDEFAGLEAVSSQSSTTGDSNNTSASIWSSPLEMSGGSFETVLHLQEAVVTTSQEGFLDVISSQSSTTDSSECTTSSARSSVLNQSGIMFKPVPPVEKPILATSHVSHTEAVSSQNSPADSTECNASRTWSSVVKQSARPSALPVSPSAKHPISTSTSPESSGRLSPPVLPTTAPANITSQAAHCGGSSQSSTADRSTITSSSARSTSLEPKRTPSSPVPITFNPATMTSPTPPASKTGAVTSPNSYNDIRKIPKGVYVVCDDFLRKNQKRTASINKKTKACKACENLSRLKYAVWNDNGKQWQLIRAYPAEKVPANVAFQECAQFSSNKPCLQNPCPFAHGPLELAMWTREREKILASPEESLQLTRASIPVASMITEPVVQGNGSNNLPLQMPENRGASMTFLGDSIVDEFAGLEAVSSQSSTTGDSNNTSASIWSSPLEISGGSFETASHLQEDVVTTSQEGPLDAISSQSSTADSSECTTSSFRSSVLNQSKIMFTPVPPMEKPILATSHVSHTEAVSSQNSPTDSTECTASPTWSSVVKQSARPSAHPVTLFTKHQIATSTSPESPTTAPANMTSQVAHYGGSSQSSTADTCRSTFTSASARSTSLEPKRRPSSPVPLTVKPAKSRAPFGRIADSEVSPQENDSQDIPKPHERVRGPSIIRDIMSDKPRPPPTGVTNGKFKLCQWWKAGRVCRYGTYCTSAHGENELKSWMGRNREIQKAKSEEELSCQKPETSADMSRSEIQIFGKNQSKCENNLGYCIISNRSEMTSKNVLSTKRRDTGAALKMAYSLPGVEVSSNKPTTVTISHRGEEKRHMFHWEFTVKFEIREVGKLCEIDLLHRYHDCYQLKKIMGFLNNVEIFSEVPEDKWLYKLPSSSGIDTKGGQMEVVVSVSFETIASNRTFTQCLRFDFGRKPYLLQGLNVDIASEEALDTLSATRQELKLHSSVWTEGSVKIIPSQETTDLSSQDMLLLKKYKLPERIENVISAQIIDGNMKVEDYKRVMHQLLFTEELFMKKAISSFVLQNVQLDCQQSISHDWSGVVYAGSGELFGILQFQESLQPDDAASRLLVRNVNCAWIKMVGNSSQKVYEAVVEKVDNERVALKFSSQICSDLNVSVGGQIFVDVQFQLNRKPLCEWHAAIDRLGPIQLRLLFPTPGASQIKLEERRPWNWLPLDPKLNTNQIEVIKRILAPGDTSSPLVVFGPFGTGKTFTLNQAIRHLVTKKHNRILLCTHTNSAADIHVTLLHNYLTTEKGLNATKPIRIYQPDRRINADSKIARMYGLIVNNAYVLPTRDDVIRHRVVITTLAMSQHLLELQLNRGVFTHILVDEAAQALEPEALTPLALAGPNTKVVFTGDHMQMSPEVYSHYARDWGLQRSLPERLFDHYCEKMHSDNIVMFLTENYRSHPDILQFPSYNFYGEELIARSEQASHPRFGTLLFFSVHGVEEARENSYINAAEIDEIVKRVELLADDWPVEWKKKDLSKIGVISAHMTQVRAIRTQLRSKGLGNVTVESIHNVQGKEFRALFISTVRTSLTCHSFERRQSESQSPCWEFLSDPKLLNTAITRAMSLVAVVGDPISLCTVGDCRGNWRDYIRRCHEHGTLHGASYEEIKKKINDPPAKITLNAEAKQFVPQLMDVSSKELTSLELASQTEISDSQISSSLEKTDLEIDKNEKSSASEIKDKCTIPTEKYRSEIETNDTKEDLTQRESTSEEDEEEHTETEGDFAFQDESQSGIQSHAKEEAVEQSTSDGFEELPRESFEDETVFPRYLDKIIEALVEKCKATREKEAHLCGPSENAAFSSLQTATTSSNQNSKSKTVKRSRNRARQEKSSSFNHSSADYEVRVVNGRQEVRIVNLGFYQMPSVRHQRLTTVSRQEDFLEPQLLQQLLVKEPEKYLSCTLRFNSEIIRTAYAEISDTKTPDIKIRGRVRRAFDMDHVVVEKTDYQPPSYDGATRCQGKVIGVLNHIINPHERQYVCKVDYENPGVMIPINKSMSKIVNLSDKNLNGLPIYRERRDGRERPFEVDVMDFTEALSGKFLFLVQYLHWRSGYQSPTGIVIRKLTQGNNLFDSMRILFAEHGVRDCFSKESEAEVRTKFPPGWSIPVEEYGRQKIDKAFTIDPANSKDLDDALTLEQLPDSVSRVGVHIADVSYFVKPGTELDKEAMFRSTSYYPGHDYPSVPMLPRELSENHCSLLPGKDRLCVSVFLNVSEKGQLIGQPQIRRTIVRSSCQLTYPEAQRVIDGQDTSLLQIPQDVKGNIRSLSALAQRRRMLRLRNASLDHWSNSDDGEDFEAHELVEEMMLLANEEVGKFLSRSQQMSERTPLRTQLPPKNHKLDDWVRQYGQFIKYSLFLRGFYSENTLRKMENLASISETSERFKVQESVWSELCNVVETGDQAKLHQLICDESNHPQLAVANSQFRRIQPKSQYVCKSDESKEDVAHFSLGMGCYTHFTSPIRRYIDIQVHRLVLGLISRSPNARISSKDDVAKICRRSTFAQDNCRKFEKASSKVHLAAKLKEKSHETTAVISLIDTDKEITLEILNREYNHLSARQRKVKLSSLNPFEVKPTPNGLEVTWRLRLYIAPEGNSIEEPEKEKEKIALLLSEGMARNSKVLDLPTENWLEILKAVQKEDYGKLKKEIRKTERARQLASRVHGSKQPKKRHKTSKDKKEDTNLEHFSEKKLSLRKFDVASIQLNAHMTRGVLHPEIQLFKINPSVHICIEHRKYPRDCFATTARYQASRKTYASARKYIEAWEPVLAMEAATGTVRESDEFTIHHLKIEWEKDINGNLEGSFCLQNEYCLSRQIEFHAGDFLCVRVREDSYMKKTGSENNFAFHEKTKTEGGTNLLNENHQFSVTTSAAPYVRGKPRHESSCASESFWVGHCIINHDYTKELPNKDTLKVVTMDLHQSASDFPVELLKGGEHLSTLTVIHRSLPHRRMFAALRSLPKASQLAHSICMGHEPNQEKFGPIPSAHLSIVREHPNCGFKPLNQYQEEAVKEALVNPFTLVQGPPGTGKTVTGVHIAYWFVKRNMQQRQDDLDIVLPDSDDQPKGPHTKVIYCGPSNKSVDVVAKYMLKIPGLKIIRVYGDRREQAEFPIPNKRQPLKNPTDDETQILNEDNELKAVSLHHVIRRSPSPFAAELKEYERKFDADRKNGLRTSNKEVEEYRELIANAECWALQQTGVQIILCTCVASGKPRLTRSCGNIQQCIVDECGMCMELESLVPITCSKARQVVLIGDHKQLQPIIQDNLAMTLGLSVSMFERLSERAKMLELQYRMQEEICRFPSKYFYKKKLKTDPSVPSFDARLQSFWPAWKSGKNVPMAFCHVEGEEESSSITTAHSNEQSKANEKEVRKVVHVATSLTYKYNVDASKVVILSPYREQRSKISESLKKVYRCKNIPVTTIVKSQGSEWDYVILSLVRSLSEDEIEPKPSLHWLREHLGFLTDEHQMNVGLTRARKGLCIIGNKNLLKVHPMWLDLINSYEENHCLVNESDWP